jgi:hypothetical protein
VEELFRHAKRQGSAFFLFGGDMVSGYTNSVESYVQQIKSFKRSIVDFTYGTPVFTAIGNHETLFHRFDDGSQYGLAMDRWPYDSVSTEAIVAREFVQPTNAPTPFDGMPPLRETVYSFHFGMVKVIVLNNNYWWTSHHRVREVGGSPEGYLMPNQLAWAEQELRAADADPKVRYVLVFAHEPAFPGGAHLSDAMWHGGNNNVRAYRRDTNDSIIAFETGVIDVRNRLWAMCTQSPKVAALLGSDEHNYQRLYISPKDPVGNPALDDLNRNGILDDGKMSPGPGFKRGLWFLISGGAGAPPYARQKSPWDTTVRKFSPQNHYILFKADARRIGIEVYARSGQLLDRVDNLMTGESPR